MKPAVPLTTFGVAARRETRNRCGRCHLPTEGRNCWGTARLENAGGAWEGTGSGVYSSDRGDIIAFWYRGTGGYAGLSYFELWTGSDPWKIRGQILPGDPRRRKAGRPTPPAPDRALRLGHDARIIGARATPARAVGSTIVSVARGAAHPETGRSVPDAGEEAPSTFVLTASRGSRPACGRRAWSRSWS